MSQQGMSIPSGSGGLMRYNEEYKGKFQIKPAHVILFIILIIAFSMILKLFFPISV